jgi:hypothetical protein
MDLLKSATFGALFAVAFTVGATFQVVPALVGLVVAVLSPGSFNANGHPVTSPGAAVGVLLLLLVFCLIMNTAIAAAGAGLWVIVRRWIPRKAVA